MKANIAKRMVMLWILFICLYSVNARADFSAPLTPASALVFTNISGTSAKLSWTNGDGARRLVVVRKDNPVSAQPVNGTTYFPSASFGSGSALAAGEYAVYGNTGNSVDIYNLLPGTTYYVSIFEYNGTGAANEFLVSSFASGSVTTETTPSVPASNMTFTFTAGDYVRVGWTNGNGARRIVVARKNSPVSSVPVDGSTYTANATFGNGSALSADEFVIYDGTSIFVDLYGLTKGTTYHFAVFEYNGAGVSTQYQVSTFLANSVTTLLPPTVPASNVAQTAATGTSVTITWTNGNGDGSLIIAREGSPVDAYPQDNVSYAVNNTFGTGGTSVGTGNYGVYKGGGTSVTLYNLKSNTTYYFIVVGFKNASRPLYISTPALGNAATLSQPTTPSSNINILNREGNQFYVGWTSGNGGARMVIARKGSAVTAVPVSGTSYLANANFGAGAQISAGQYVVYNGTGASFTLQNLEVNTAYYFAIYEYDGSGASSNYLTGSYAQGNGSTVAAPSLQVSNLQLTGNSSTSLSLNWIPGDGSGRIIIARKDQPVTVAPVDLNNYLSSPNYGSGTLVEPDAYVVFKGAGTSVTVSNLAAGATYYFSAFEYNGSVSPVYQAAAPATFFAATASLPVRLTGFGVRRENVSVLINWQTADEWNSDRFEIERSFDGRNFFAIGSVRASGNTNGITKYHYEDKSAPYAVPLYYRLRVVDADESFTVSSQYYLPASKATIGIAAIIPVDARTIRLKMNGRIDPGIFFQIADFQGIVIQSGVLSGNGTPEIRLPALMPKGPYILSLRKNGSVISKMFFKI